MSDDNGNLLFYTDGLTVWDKNNNMMFNGTGLRGGSSSSQSSIVVPAPGSLKKYYIFTSVQVEADPSNKREYCYNLVDMGLRGGLGEVVQKNVVFDTACSERLTAANHANGSDFWIITNSVRSNTFKVFALTASGLSTNPIIQNIGETVLGGIGMCKVSPNGKWLIQTYTKTNLSSAQLFSFNAATGQITNPISLNTAFNCTYGCAFSPNSNRLYLSTGFNCTGNPANTIIQFTLSNSLPAILLNSLTPIIVNTNALGSGDLSIGLDEKLYIARVGQRLSRFENPNDTGTSLIFTDTAILFSNPSRVLLGLPNYYNNINLPPSTIKIIEQSCLTYKFSFPASANFPFVGIYSWNFGDGSALSNDSTPTHSFTKGWVDSFLVSLNFRSPDNTISINQEIWIKLPPKPSAQFTFQTNGCANDSVRFTNTSTSNNGAITKSFWSFGDGTFSNSFQPKKNYNDTGTFAIKLVVTDTLGCTSDTLAKPIILNKKVKANFTLLSPLCKGVSITIIDSSVAINTTINNWSYRWNNNFGYNANNNGNFNFIPTTQELYTFKLVVNTVEGCVSDTITKSYLVNNNPVANFSLPKSCVLDRSDFINTSTTPTGSVINFYKWDFGVNDRLSDTSRLANGSYQYDVANVYPVSLLVINDKGCRDSLTQNFIVNGAVNSTPALLAILK
ncbi:MAG: PKD domain-containing protein, partial [Chitinophagaceae bacterium]